MAPVLTRLFTPLFTVLLLAFLAAMAWTGNPINEEREVLIGFDLLLALVVGLVLYAASARDPQAPPGFFDGLQLLLVVSALAVDGVALAAIAARNSGFGFTPNRVAALGEDLILLVNLACRRGSLHASCAAGVRLPTWSAGKSPIFPFTPHGRRRWLSYSRPCSATVDARPRPRTPAVRFRDGAASRDVPIPCAILWIRGNIGFSKVVQSIGISRAPLPSDIQVNTHACPQIDPRPRPRAAPRRSVRFGPDPGRQNRHSAGRAGPG
jgi:hypothetical protein